MTCPEAEEGVRDECCLHDIREGEQHYPGRVCCWCGLVFLPDNDATEHGPNAEKGVRLKRRAKR